MALNFAKAVLEILTPSCLSFQPLELPLEEQQQAQGKQVNQSHGSNAQVKITSWKSSPKVSQV
jgi:hypothetical protein